VSGLELLHGGFWSAAFGYQADGRELVVRFGKIRDGFEMDRLAMAFDGPDLPVPEVLEIGDAFGRSYAISVRHRGRFLETVRPEEADVAGPTIVRLLSTLRALPSAPGLPVSWLQSTVGKLLRNPAEPQPTLTWRQWVLDGLVDDPHKLVHGWRAVLAADRGLDALFRTCETRVGELADSCPERRDVVHGDLLHSNVLINDDASRITAVFSWKCSVRGDFLFDLAWCTFWGAFHPGIEAADLWTRVLADPSIPPETLADASQRHHCYELQIGATHLGWNAWVDDQDGLRDVASHTAHVLERGPLSRIPP